MYDVRYRKRGSFVGIKKKWRQKKKICTLSLNHCIRRSARNRKNCRCKISFRTSNEAVKKCARAVRIALTDDILKRKKTYSRRAPQNNGSMASSGTFAMSYKDGRNRTTEINRCRNGKQRVRIDTQHFCRTRKDRGKISENAHSESLPILLFGWRVVYVEKATETRVLQHENDGDNVIKKLTEKLAPIKHDAESSGHDARTPTKLNRRTENNYPSIGRP